MQADILQKSQLKAKLPEIKPGDTIRVHQLIREGAKSRTQIFEGLVIRYRKPNSGNAFLTVRKIASGVGVEKGWFVHSPNVQKLEVLRRSKVRRAFLSYMRGLRGKKARLTEQDFDKAMANDADHRTADELAVLAAETKAAEAEITATEDAVVESTEELAQEESKEAAQADAPADELGTGEDTADVKAEQGDDEQQLAAQETNEGLDKTKAKTDDK
ncbi:MAG: 50S ribosomal protein L19 [bacterium]